MEDLLTLLVELEEKLKWENLKDKGLLPIPSTLDNDISRLINRYVRVTAEEQAFIKDTFTDKNSFAFIGFSERMACLAVREKKEKYLVEGLVAHAIEGGKFDTRENILVLSLLYHSAIKIGADPIPLFTQASQLAEGEIAGVIAHFPYRKPEDRSIQAMGYEESKDQDGFRYKRTW